MNIPARNNLLELCDDITSKARKRVGVMNTLRAELLTRSSTTEMRVVYQVSMLIHDRLWRTIYEYES